MSAWYDVQISQWGVTQSFDFEIHNEYSSSKTVRVKRYLDSYSSGQDIYYCFGTNCYAASTAPLFAPSQSRTIPANGMLPDGAGTYGIKTDFDDNSVVGTSDVRYTVYDVNNIADSVYK